MRSTAFEAYKIGRRLEARSKEKRLPFDELRIKRTKIYAKSIEYPPSPEGYGETSSAVQGLE